MDWSIYGDSDAAKNFRENMKRAREEFRKDVRRILQKHVKDYHVTCDAGFIAAVLKDIAGTQELM